MPKKFSPLQWSERSKKTMLVGLGIFLMIIFAIPFGGSCRGPRQGGGPNRDQLVATIEGKRIYMGDVEDNKIWNSRLFGVPLTDRDALRNLVHIRDAERAGVRISDIEVADFIHNGDLRTDVLARRVRVEFAIAETRGFEKVVKVEAKEIEAFYREHRTRFRLPDKTMRPIGEVREEITREIRTEKAKAKGHEALIEFTNRVETIIGAALDGAFFRLGPGHGLRPVGSDMITARTAFAKLGEIADARGLTSQIFTSPIGKISEPLEFPGGQCVFRVTHRTHGFDPEGNWHPADEGWVGQGYGVTGRKSYLDAVRDMQLSPTQLERVVRDHIAMLVAPGLVDSGVLALADATLDDRYERDNSRAMAAYFALRTADFTDEVKFTESELQTFYDQRKNIERAEGRVGYLRPPRVSIEFVVGRLDKMAEAIEARDVAVYYESHKAQFKGAEEEVTRRIRRLMAEEKIRGLMTDVESHARARAGETGTPDLGAAVAVAVRGSRRLSDVLVARRTEPFSAFEAERAVSELQGGRLAEILFGEKGDQYVVEGAKADRSKHLISEDFACPAGRFLFRVLKREPSAEVPYASITPAVRQELIQDVIHSKAVARAKEQARGYRESVFQTAFDRFARLVESKPAEVDLPTAESPIPSVGQALPALNDQMAVAEPGDLSDVFGVGGQCVLARLVSREPAKPVHLQVITCRAADFKKAYEPAAYELEARYVADPYAYLEPPTPIAFERVETEIRKVLAHRRALAVAGERTDAAAAAAAGVLKADLAPVATKQKLAIETDVKVDLAKTAATPRIGKALGFSDAVASLKVGEASGALASADGRYVFVLKARDPKSATIDFVAANYDAIAGDIKVGPQDVQGYYDRYRDTAYMTNDEIKPAAPWAELTKEAVERVSKAVVEDWTKKPPVTRMAQLRDSLVEEAFRTVPAAKEISAPRQVKLTILNKGPILLADPPEVIDREPELLKAILTLRPGDVSAPVPLRDGAALAFLGSAPAKGVMDVDLVVIGRKDVAVSGGLPSPEEVRAFYESHKELFRAPDQLKVRLLAVSYADLMKKLSADDEEVQKEYDRSLKAGEPTYRDLSKPGTPVLPLAQAQDLVRRTLLLGKARAEAEKLLSQAKEAAQAPDADWRTVADKLPPAFVRISPFFDRGEVSFGPLGRVPVLAALAFAAKDTEVLGPYLGTEGACLVKRQEFRPSRIAPIEEVEPAAAIELRLDGTRPRVLEAAGKLRERVEAAIAQGENKRDAFRKAVEGAPLLIHIPTPVRVVVAAPFFPTDAGQMRPSLITGLGAKPELTRAVFRLRPGQVSSIVEDVDGSACYVAVMTSLMMPPKATPQQILESRIRLMDPTQRAMQASWDRYFQQQIQFPENR